MKQSSFWDKQEIVKDRETIKKYLAQMMRILAGHPHNQGEAK